MTAAELAEQLTMRELLEDPIYKKWIRTTPQLHVFSASGKPWRVWAQRKRGGGWSRREFATYVEAFNFMARLLRDEFHDATVCSKIHGFQPPVVRDKRTQQKRHHVPGKPGQSDKHMWCPHCRRPTVFTTFLKHHAFDRLLYNTYTARCAICGIAETAIRHYR